MKQLKYSLLVLFWLNLAQAQTTYYSNDLYADFNDIRGWGLNADGSGSNPALLSNQVILVQKHTKSTSNICTIRALHIQTGGKLEASHSIYLDGTGKYFRIDSGGTYVHNHAISLGAALFSGSEIFASGSTCEFKLWPPTLPAADWGNLVFNNPQSSSNCQLGGFTSLIKNNLVVQSGNGIISLSGNGNLSIQINGNIEVLGGVLDIANGQGIQANRTVNLMGSLYLKGGTLRCTGSSNKAWLQFGGSLDTLEIQQGIWNGQNINLTCLNGSQLFLKGNIEIQSGCSLVLAGATSEVRIFPGTELRNQGIIDARTGNLVFESTSSGTSSYGESSGSFLGMGTFKQWIPAGFKRFRFLSSPVQNADFWQLQDDIHVTGQGGPSNGFDSTPTNNPSLFFYTESVVNSSPNIGWEPVTHINQAMQSAKGYRVLVRGPRSNNQLLYNNSPVQPECTLGFFGPPHRGNIPINGIASYTPGNGAADGWNLLGNPYPSAINWEEMIQQGDFDSVYPYLYLRDAKSGNYVAWNGLTGMGTGSPLIPAYSGFLVQFFGTPSGSFKEARKQQQINPGIFKTKTQTLKLKISSTDLSDLVQLAWLDSGALHTDNREDIPKLLAASTMMATKNESGNWVCMDLRTSNRGADTVQLLVGGVGKLKLELLEKEVGVGYYLEDIIKQSKQELTSTGLMIEPGELDSLRFRIIRMPATGTGFAEMKKAELDIFPNPATDRFRVGLNENLRGNLNLCVYEVSGRLVQAQKFSAENPVADWFELDASTYQNGIYILELSNENNRMTGKLIVSKP